MATVKKRLLSDKWYFQHNGKDIQVRGDVITADSGTFDGATKADPNLKFEDVEKGKE